MAKWLQNGILIIGIIFAFLAVYYALQSNKNLKECQSIQNKIDSLKTALESQRQAYEKTLFSYNRSIDSLMKVKQQIITKYETKYINFADPLITPDDTVTEYISTKIHNSK